MSNQLVSSPCRFLFLLFLHTLPKNIPQLKVSPTRAGGEKSGSKPGFSEVISVFDWQIDWKLVRFKSSIHIFIWLRRAESWNLDIQQETKFISIPFFFSSSCHSFCFAISFTFLSASEKLKVFCIQARKVHEWVSERDFNTFHIWHWLCVTGCNRRNGGEKVHHDYCQNVVKLQISWIVFFLLSPLQPWWW